MRLLLQEIVLWKILETWEPIKIILSCSLPHLLFSEHYQSFLPAYLGLRRLIITHLFQMG